MIPEDNKRPVVLLDDDGSRSDRFALEHARLAGAIGGCACVLDIQHIGSTSVPGLAAKPIVDIAVCVTSFEEAFVCVAPVQALGYVYKGECGVPRRHYFSRNNDDEPDAALRRTHHVHIVESEAWNNYLAFRDALRASASLARQYEELKRTLARQFPDDTHSYCDGKTDFILGVLTRVL